MNPPDPSLTVGDPVTPTAGGKRRREPSLRHLRWLVPLALAATVLLVVSLVAALRYSPQPAASSVPTMVPSVGFFKPKSSVPVRFSLPVLQRGALSAPATSSSQATSSRQVTMTSLVGKPLVINMWASTCTVCMQETPDVEAMARKLGGKVQFVGIDTTDQRSAALSFLRRYHVSYLQLFDPNDKVGGGYGIPGLPVTIFVTAKGKVVGENLGALTTSSLAHDVTRLFGVKVPT